MTDAALQGMALQSLNMAKRDLERGKFNFLLAAYHEGEGLRRMRSVETLVIEKLGRGWLNDARAKDAGFWVLRKATEIHPPDAIAFAALASEMRPTEKMKALSPEEQRRLLESNDMVDGFMVSQDVVYITAQTPLRVCTCVQKVYRHRYIDAPELKIGDMTKFSGRSKLFGPVSGFSAGADEEFTKRMKAQ